MVWRELHAQVLCHASEKLLGGGERSAMAFIRCLPSSVVRSMSADSLFAPKGWVVRCVADKNDDTTRTITADEAVEFREAKADPVLLLVDTALAGAGMDGIYSAAEKSTKGVFLKRRSVSRHAKLRRRGPAMSVDLLNTQSRRLEVVCNETLSRPGLSLTFSFVSPPTVDFRAKFLSLRALAYQWAKWFRRTGRHRAVAKVRRQAVGSGGGRKNASQRIASLKLLSPTKEQTTDLERFLRDAAIAPSQTALEQLSDRPDLHIGALQPKCRQTQSKPFHLCRGISTQAS